MKLNKVYIAVAIIMLIAVIVATVIIARPLIIKYEFKRIAKEAEEKAETIEDNSVEVAVIDPTEYDSIKVDIEEVMDEEVLESHQDPEKNEEYDKQVNELVDFVADDLPKSFKEIINRRKRIVSMEYTLVDKRIKGGYRVDALIYYQYPFQNEQPLLGIKVRDIDYRSIPRLRYDVMGYVGFNSFAISFGYEPFKWLRIGTMISIHKIYIDKKEEILMNPAIGVGINFY